MIAVKRFNGWDAAISQQEIEYIKSLVKKDLEISKTSSSQQINNMGLALGILKEIEEQEQTTKESTHGTKQ